MLRGRLVALSPLSADDVTNDYVGWLNDPSTFEFLNTKFGQTQAMVRAYVESVKPPNLLCKVLRKDDGLHVGNIALHQFDPVHRTMEIGLVIGVPEARGKGFGRDACSTLIEYGFDHLNIHKVVAGTVVANTAMTQVFLSLGFVIEGTLAQHHFLKGQYQDMHVFGLLRDNFKPVHHIKTTHVDGAVPL